MKKLLYILLLSLPSCEWWGPEVFTEITGISYIPKQQICVNFSPYVDGQDPNRLVNVQESQIRERLRMLWLYASWIRTFGATHGLEHIPRIAREMGFRVVAGCWLGRDLAANEKEIENLIAIGRAGYAERLVVGSEVLLRRDLTAQQLIAYIQRVREAVPGIPITTADTYGSLIANPEVRQACDFLFPNIYPYWEWESIDCAMYMFHQSYLALKAVADGKPIIISESGWPTDGNSLGAAEPSLDNACDYLIHLVNWSRTEEVQVFLFSAFDEAWKARYEGPQGAHWGIFDKDGQLKPCMIDLFEGKIVPLNWDCVNITGQTDSVFIAFTSVPAYGSFDNLSGVINGVAPCNYSVLVIIKVNGRWWIKPYSNAPKTRISCKGVWWADITTGGMDRNATEIAAFLVPASYQVPSILNASRIPQDLIDKAVAAVYTTRNP